MALRFTTTDVAGAVNGVKFCVFGLAKVGKTRLCATAPNPIIISAENGLMSLRGSRIPTVEITSLQDLTDAYAWVAQSAEAKQFQTICVDSASDVAERVLETEKARSKDPRKAYGEMQTWVLQYLKLFRDLPGKHVYFSAKQAMIKDETAGLTSYGPSMPGQQLGPAIPYLFDEIFHLGLYPNPNQPGQTFAAIRTKANMQYSCGDRSGALAEFEPPDLSAIIRKITGG